MTRMENAAFARKYYDVLSADKLHKWVIVPMGDFVLVQLLENIGYTWLPIGCPEA